jgi:hypothetical protein
MQPLGADAGAGMVQSQTSEAVSFELLRRKKLTFLADAEKARRWIREARNDMMDGGEGRGILEKENSGKDWQWFGSQPRRPSEYKAWSGWKIELARQVHTL